MMNAIVILLVMIGANLTIAETCTTSKNIVGQCVKRESCESYNEFQTRSAFKQLSQGEQKNELIKWRCGRRNSLVCCPNDTPYSEPPLSVEKHKNLHLLPQECGKKSLSDRLFGANVSDINEFPWMALISTYTRKGNIVELNFTCGGTVINSRYILTAAHCITKLASRVLAGVRLGEWDISQEKDCVDEYCAPAYQDIAIEEVIPHPRYVAGNGNKDLNNDIGLLRLASPIDLTVANVAPICLPTTKQMREANLMLKKLVITGWGTTPEKGFSDKLLYFSVPIVSNRLCAEKYNNSDIGGIGFRHLCASGLEGISTCTGDSGGPMMLEIRTDKYRYVQYGVISAGYGTCGAAGQPGILTNVLYYMDWILETIKP